MSPPPLMLPPSLPPLGGAVREAASEEVGTYITRKHNVAAQYIAMWMILELCEEAERRPRVHVTKPWWEQEGINLDGEQAATATTAEAGEAYEVKEEGQMTEAGG